MSRQYQIKWRSKDYKELRRVARNFNDKLRRLTKKAPQNKNILPQFYNEATDQFESRITLTQLKSMIQTRQDYNRFVNMLKRFSKRGAEKIVEAPDNIYNAKITKWQRQEEIRLASIVNRKRKERLERLNLVEMMDASGKLGYTLGQMFGMGLASKNKLQPTKAFTPSQSQTDIKQKFRSLLSEASTNYHRNRDDILRENYIRTLEENYRSADIKDVISRIRSMDPDAFVLKFEAKGDAFEFAYPPDEEQYQSYLSELKAYWLRADSILDLSPTLASTMIQ